MKDTRKSNAIDLGEYDPFLEAKTLLEQSRNTINHARQWRKNVDPGFEDNGGYKLMCERIDTFLSSFKKLPAYFIATENGITDIDTPPSDN